MSGVAIVAVPNKSNPVWAVSSEKIPHMTLLYLGDALAEEDYRKVQEFVTHVADTTLHRFGMSVDKRGTLGDDDADVLFFHNEENSAISLFRAYLLQDTTIREAYEKTEQFDGWTPHLTLGYPDSPAKKDPREDSEFYYISFDKLMIWTDEFAGPEIELNDLGAAVAMSGVADATQTFLAHYGVKGMRWGVRKDALTTGRYGSTHGPVRAGVRLGGDKRPSGIDKLSDKYNRTDLGKVTTAVTRVLYSGPYTAVQTASLVALTGATALSAGATAPVTATVIGAIIGQSAATHGLHAAWSNKDNVRRINNNPKYKGKNLKADKKLRKEYHDEQMHSLGRALWDPRGVRLAETRARVTGNPGDKSIVVKPYGLIQHSVEDLSLTIDVVYNGTGHILEFVPRVPENIAKKFYEIVNNDGSMAQSDLDFAEEFLAHFGVKGMRWGVRKQDGASGSSGGLKSNNEWRKETFNSEAAGKILSTATKTQIRDVERINTKYGNKLENRKQQRAYRREVEFAARKNLDAAARKVIGVSPDGTRTASATLGPSGILTVKSVPLGKSTPPSRSSVINRDPGVLATWVTGQAAEALGHGDVLKPELRFEMIVNTSGMYTGELRFIGVGNGELTQSDLDFAEEFLAHVGVKGMRWGVRRSREERRADRTAKVQAAAEKKVAKAEQYTARANAKASVAKARTATADAKAAAANARLETKLAEKQAKFAKAEARSGKDDPANGLIRDTSGLVGSSNRESAKLRDNAIKDLRTLDDQTLKAYSERINTEKKLKETIKQDQAPGRTATKKLIADAGKDVAKTALVGAGSMAVYYLLGRVGASRGQNPKPKINWEGAANTTTNSKSKAKDAFDFAKEAADAARTTTVPKNKYPGAIPTTGRALPTTGSSAPPGYKLKPGFDPDNWTLRPGKEP